MRSLLLLLASASLAMADEYSLRDEFAPIPAVERAALLRAVCENKATLTGKAVGCKVCPSYVGMELKDSLTVDGLVFGAFTATGKAEAIARVQGCESHSANFGGLVLLQRTANGWTRTGYSGGLPGACQKVTPPGGPDRLFCRTGFTQSGTVELSVYLQDGPSLLDDAPERERDERFPILSNSEGACPLGLKTYTFGDFDKFTFTATGLTILLNAGKVRCGVEAPDKGAVYRLDYVWTKGLLEPTPATKLTLKRLEKLSN